MQDTVYLIGNLLVFTNIENLPDHVERGSSGFDRNDGISQSRNRCGLIRESTSQPLIIEVKGKIKAGHL
jgi:hypothetical protein